MWSKITWNVIEDQSEEVYIPARKRIIVLVLLSGSQMRWSERLNRLQLLTRPLIRKRLKSPKVGANPEIEMNSSKDCCLLKKITFEQNLWGRYSFPNCLIQGKTR